MPVELNIHNDFSTIIDGAEQVTLHRRGTATTVALPHAWRYSSLTQQTEAGSAGIVRSDVVWQFEWDVSLDLPRVGDTIIDATSDFWTILSVEIRGNNSRLRCTARNLRIVHQLNDRIEIQEAIWDTSGPEPEITGWQTIRTAIPASIQPDHTTIDTTADPPTSIATYSVTLADDLPLNHNHRLVGPEGTIYQLVEYTGTDRIDTLPVATVVKLQTMS